MVLAASALEVALEPLERRVTAKASPELRGHDPGLVRGGEQTHVVEVCLFRLQAEIPQEELPSQRPGQAIRFRPNRGQRSEGAPSQPPRQVAAHSGLQQVQSIAPLVTREYLVPPIPGQGNRYPLAG